MPDVSHLHVWGCKIYCKIPIEIRKDKERPCTQEGIFLGYTDTNKSFLVLIDHGVQQCRDIVFDETPFPEAPIPGPHPSIDLSAKPLLVPSSQPGPVEYPTSPLAKRRKVYPITAAGTRPQRITSSPVLYAALTAAPVVPCTLANPHTPVPLPDLPPGTDLPVPGTYQETLQGPYAFHWHNAVQSEINSLKDRQVYRLVPLPTGRKALSSKWTFVWKSEHGLVTRAKARLVAKGFMQKEGVDFNDIFAPTGNQDSLRLLFAMAAQHNLILHSVDVKTAFLYGILEEDIYLKQPDGCIDPIFPDYVWKLDRAIYGLKQASRVWYHKLKDVLVSMDYFVSPCDPAVFYRYEDDGQKSYLFVFVDDIIIAHSSQLHIDSIKEELSGHLEITDCGQLHCFTAIEIVRGMDQSVFIHQATYADSLIKKFHTFDTSKATPLPPGVQFSKLQSSQHENATHPNNLPADPLKYRQLIGSLAYLANQTRPDISYAVNTLTKYFNAPSMEHWDAGQYVLSYLLGTTDFGILYTKQKNTLSGYTDSSFGSDFDSLRSVTGQCFLMNNSIVSWRAHLQPTVALSSTEAEYMAANDSGRTALSLVQIRNIFNCDPVECVRIHSIEPVPLKITYDIVGAKRKLNPQLIQCDSKGAIHLLNNSHLQRSSKHIDITIHWCREHIANNRLKFEYIRGNQNPADMFTKPLPSPAFRTYRDIIGVISKSKL
jgi:hypothetical protein